MATLTIVVPVYNARAFLAQCVDSILAQTFTDFTLLLLDDGSSDDSGTLCDLYAAQDARVCVIHHPNMGVEQTVLKGIQMADTPYIGFVDSDDWLLPEMYQTMLDAMQAHDADAIQCGALINGATPSPALCSEKQVTITNPYANLYRPFFEQTATLAPLTNARWSKVYKTPLLKQAIAHLSQGVSIGEDLLLNLAYLRSCNKVVVLGDSNYYCYRSHSGSLSMRYTDKKQDSILKLYPLLSILAVQEGFQDDAILRQGKDETCALMLEVLLSSLPIPQKAARVRGLRAHLADNTHLMQYAAQRPLVGRLALYFVRLQLIGIIATLVSAMLSITRKKGA